VTRLALVLALAGCPLAFKEQTIGPFVTDVRVEGYALVVARCEVVRTGDGLSLGTCKTTRQALPVTFGQLPATLQVADIAAGVAPARPAVATCLARAGVATAVRVDVTIDYRGRAIAVVPASGCVAAADCIGEVLGAVRFPPSGYGARATVPFEP